MASQLFAKKSLETLHKEMEGEDRLHRVLGPVSLTALGVGAIIGAGIFVMTGRAAHQDAGPAIMVSYCVAGLGCALAAFCYAEFAALAPVAGSAYTYAYATLGEVFAWIIGWDLILEYAMSCSCVASAWSNYLNKFLKVLFGFEIPSWLSQDPVTNGGVTWDRNAVIGMSALALVGVIAGLRAAATKPNILHGLVIAATAGGIVYLGKTYLHLQTAFNLPAMLIMVVVTTILVVGIRESALANAILTCVKLGVVLFVIAVGYGYVNRDNWTKIPMTERRTQAESYVIPSLVQAELKSTGLKDLELEKRSGEVIPMVAAAYRSEFVPAEVERLKKLGKFTDDQAKAAIDAEQKRNAPKMAASEPDKKLVESIMTKARVKEKEIIAEKWGMLAYLGLNEKLASIDDSFRSNFFPFGLSGVMLGASIVFFAFIGFDSISAHSEEAKVPQRDVPIGIIASLVICTFLYLCVSGVITGMVPYPQIDTKAAIAAAFSDRAKTDQNPALNAAAGLIATGALAGLTSVLLITFLSQARVFLAMARDGFLPPSIFGKIHPTLRTPHVSTIFTGVLIMLVAGFTPIEKLEEMVNIGTLFAFVVVCAAVLVLRIKRPEAKRPFKCPLVWIVAPLGVAVNLTMMLFLPVDTWIRLVVWLGIGMGLYFGYGYWHSVHGRGMPAPDV